MRRPVDHEARSRATTDLTTTFLVHASAGTGKTRLLVERFITCLRSGAAVRSVAAITFTEKAAGELRQRIRLSLDALLAVPDAGLTSVEHERVEAALGDLDEAPISTIHSFAARLLRERPVEAEVDPAFVQLDALQSGLTLGDLWDEWIAGVMGDTAAGAQAGTRERLREVLLAGVPLDQLRSLAIEPPGAFTERYDVDASPPPREGPSLAGRVEEIAELATELERARARCLDCADAGFVKAGQAVTAVRRLADVAAEGDVHALAAAVFACPDGGAPGGNKKNWPPGGKETLVARYESLTDAVAAARDEYGAWVAALALSVAHDFAAEAAQRQSALGKLDFADLLGKTRDLLLGRPDVRAAFQAAFAYLLVDEFQDTDPLQAEIVFLLAEERALVDDWRAVRLKPGKLFVVGDPKQSIYRFRRADITLFDEVRALIAAQGEVLTISENFRTTPAIAGWVNACFSKVIGEDACEGRQPLYVPIEPFRPESPGSLRVQLVYDEPADGGKPSADVARRREAEAIAALLTEAVTEESAWYVRGFVDAQDGERLRPAGWGDCAVLLRTYTGLGVLERAFTEVGIPYRVEGGKAYFQRREICDALLTLRAVDDAADPLAVYAALHSSLFGFTDEDLFLFQRAGGSFDYLAPQPDGFSEVLAALDLLRELHESRTQRPVDEIVFELLRRTGACEFHAAWGTGAEQALANLDKLLHLARAFAAEGSSGLGGFVRWAQAATEGGDEGESLVDEGGDAVRITSIHKAKGLEFPIVVIPGGSGASVRGERGTLVDRHARRLQCSLSIRAPGGKTGAGGSGSVRLQTAGYEELFEVEQEMAASELRRLLYVAATRAGDHLVITCFREPDAGGLLSPLQGLMPAAGTVEAECEEGGARVRPLTAMVFSPPAEGPVEDVAELGRRRAQWTAEHDALFSQAGRPAPVTSPSRLERVADQDESDAVTPAGTGRARALRLGTAVHRVMERVSLDGGDLQSCVQQVTTEEGLAELAPRVAELAEACLKSEPVRAAAAAHCHRELPLAFTVEGTTVSGAVDLLYRDGDSWVIVDYKTDRSAEAERLRDQYELQGGAYALGVMLATGVVVREVVFVLAGAAVEGRGAAPLLRVPVDERLYDRVRARIREVAFRGEPLAVPPE